MDVEEVRAWLANWTDGARACKLLGEALDEIDRQKSGREIEQAALSNAIRRMPVFEAEVKRLTRELKAAQSEVRVLREQRRRVLELCDQHERETELFRRCHGGGLMPDSVRVDAVRRALGVTE